MGHVVAKLPHSCGTKEGLRVFAKDDGTVDGYCFRCDTYVQDPYDGKPKRVEDLPKPKIKSAEELAEELAEVAHFQTIDVPIRKLRAKNLAKFGTKIALSERDGKTPQAMYFPLTKNGEVTGYQVKTVGLGENNRVWMMGDCKDVDLFNWVNANGSGAYRLIITEGMPDAVAVDRMFEMYGKEEYMPAIVSLQYGAGRARQSLQKHAKEIKAQFREVVLCFDDDAAGHEAVKQAMLVLPHAKSVTLSEKDANECLVKGKAKAAYNALSFQAAKPKNTRLVSTAEIHEKAKQPAKFGELTWPWENMNKDLRGIRLGETIYLGAGTKIGKTTVKNALGAHFIQNDNTKVFMACPEEPNEMTYKLVANQLTGKVFHDPEVEFDDDAYERAGAMMKDKLYMLNLYQHLGWGTLKDDIVAAADAGCKVVMIDPVTNISNGVSSSEANTLLQEFAQELAAMAMDLNFTAFIFAHLKASEGQISQEKRQAYYHKGHYLDLGNCSHEMGGSVYSSQFAGSRAMQRSCHLMLGMLGNKDPELPDEVRNMRQIRTLEDRAWGSSGKYDLFYNKNTGRLAEV